MISYTYLFLQKGEVIHKIYLHFGQSVSVSALSQSLLVILREVMTIPEMLGAFMLPPPQIKSLIRLLLFLEKSLIKRNQWPRMKLIHYPDI